MKHYQLLNVQIQITKRCIQHIYAIRLCTNVQHNEVFIYNYVIQGPDVNVQRQHGTTEWTKWIKTNRHTSTRSAKTMPCFCALMLLMGLMMMLLLLLPLEYDNAEGMQTEWRARQRQRESEIKRNIIAKILITITINASENISTYRNNRWKRDWNDIKRNNNRKKTK